MNFSTAIKTCFRKYATFKGRAPRSEYWWFYALYTALEIASTALDETVFNLGPDDIGLFGTGLLVVMLLPGLAVHVRRFHDTGRSGWWLALLLVVAVFAGIAPEFSTPDWVNITALIALVICGLTSLVWVLRKGSRFENRFGPDPLNNTPDNRGEDDNLGPSTIPTVARD